MNLNVILKSCSVFFSMSTQEFLNNLYDLFILKTIFYLFLSDSNAFQELSFNFETVPMFKWLNLYYWTSYKSFLTKIVKFLEKFFFCDVTIFISHPPPLFRTFVYSSFVCKHFLFYCWSFKNDFLCLFSNLAFINLSTLKNSRSKWRRG